MADEARLNELLDLVEQARAEGDTATEQKATDAYKRESAPHQPFPDVYGGAGGYNPMLSGVAGLVQRGGESLGMTPENTANPVANAAGPAETAMQLGTGALAFPAAGMAGIGQGVKNLFSPGMPAADRVRQIQEALTYQPRTGAGQGMSAAASALPQAYEKGTNYLGEKTTDVTGSPAAGAFIKTLGDIAPSVVGARLGPQRVPGPRPTGKYAPTKWDVPTTEQLKKASQESYKAADEAGVIVPQESYGKALESVRGMVKKEGIDPTLHPKSTAVVRRLDESDGKPLTLQEAETLRKIALDAEDDLNPVTRQPTPDARLAGKIVDELDDKIDALSANDQARALWSRSRRSQMIDRAISRAEIKAGAHYTQAGMEHALRQEFKQLALNERRMRGLSKDQQAAIRKVAAGGPVENTLRGLGKFDPTSSPVAAMSSLGSSALLSTVNPAAAALPVAGWVSKRLATGMTKRNVDAAREALVGRGVPTNASPLRKAAPAASPTMDSLPFSMTPGVMPSRTGPLSRGLELEPSPVPNAQQLPNFLGRPGDLTAETPPPMMGGIPYRPARNASLAGDLSLEGPTPKYPGGVDFTPSALPPQIPRDLALALVSEKTRATAAKARPGSLDLPAVRPKKDVQADIRRLEARIRGLSREQEMDGSYTNALSQEWRKLQTELASSESRAASKR